MKVVIQCAASKRDHDGGFTTGSGEKLLFVAAPELCVSVPPGMRYARPDDPCGEEKAGTWRDMLKRYNEQPDNPCKLLRAADLYSPKEHEFRNLYRELADAFGWDNLFILSAGLGLIRAGFWTPDYKVTFSAQVKKEESWTWRNSKASQPLWHDFNHLCETQIGQDEPIHFFGGKDYLPTFYTLLETLPGKKIVHYMGRVVEHSGFKYKEYKGPEKNRTWHYRAAKDFLGKRPVVEH